jgi:very-short-patch-repair endonuclease
VDAWREAAESQGGLVTRRQLRAAGVRSQAAAHRFETERWQSLSPTVVATFTGELTAVQRLWLGVLHGGEGALVAGLHAGELGGLKNWHRDEITVLVPSRIRVPTELSGYRFVRTVRDLGELRSAFLTPPTCRPIAAVLLWASEQDNIRTTRGVLAAVVQQRLATPEQLIGELDRLGRLRWAGEMRRTLIEIAGGAQSVAELDVRRMCRVHRLALPTRQVKRHDSGGRVRFTDCEWTLPDGRVLVLEVDGAFHMEAQQWEDDLARQRALSGSERLIVRCTARELRDEPERVARDLVRLGVPRAA